MLLLGFVPAPANNSEAKFCADSTKSPSDETKNHGQVTYKCVIVWLWSIEDRSGEEEKYDEELKKTVSHTITVSLIFSVSGFTAEWPNNVPNESDGEINWNAVCSLRGSECNPNQFGFARLLTFHLVADFQFHCMGSSQRILLKFAEFSDQ